MDGVTIHITACDLLADDYNRMMQKENITPLIPVEGLDMSKMSYADNSFDIVHCNNALDHTLNPERAVQEMIRVCKHGGYVYLRHYHNVGENNNYTGLHFWNICRDGNGCRIWNQKHELFINIPTTYEDNMVVSVYQK